jgi:hypothetical protein
MSPCSEGISRQVAEGRRFSNGESALTDFSNGDRCSGGCFDRSFRRGPLCFRARWRWAGPPGNARTSYPRYPGWRTCGAIGDAKEIPSSYDILAGSVGSLDAPVSTLAEAPRSFGPGVARARVRALGSEALHRRPRLDEGAVRREEYVRRRERVQSLPAIAVNGGVNGIHIERQIHEQANKQVGARPRLQLLVRADSDINSLHLWMLSTAFLMVRHQLGRTMPTGG